MELETTKLESADPLLSLGVILDFQPIAASVQINQHPKESPAPSISMPLKLFSGQTVRTPEERELNAMTWTLTIHRGVTEIEDLVSPDAIGKMNYYACRDDVFAEIPESSYLWTRLEGRSFDLLTQFVLAGHVPKNIRVHAKGLKYGWEPDGSAAVWDIANQPHATITDVEMELAAVAGQDDADSEQTSLQPRRPVTNEDLQRCRDDLVSTMLQTSKTLSSRVGWILVLVAALAVAAIFRYP